MTRYLAPLLALAACAQRPSPTTWEEHGTAPAGVEIALQVLEERGAPSAGIVDWVPAQWPCYYDATLCNGLLVDEAVPEIKVVYRDHIEETALAYELGRVVLGSWGWEGPSPAAQAWIDGANAEIARRLGR